MKKSIIVSILLLQFCLSACGGHQVSVEQSQKNFTTYLSLLEDVVNEYGAELIETMDINIEDQDSYMDLGIEISNDETIAIRMINSAYDSKKGTESFSIDYVLNNEDDDHQFNIDLFVELVNCISKKPISTTFCEEFLDAPENVYSAEDYGHSKQNGEIIFKLYSFNFSEDWTLCYILYEDQTERLTFGGLTSQINR